MQNLARIIKVKCNLWQEAIKQTSVVLRDSVRIAVLALLIAGLNELDVLACDIQNAYLTAQYRESVYTISVDEFRSDLGNS